MPLTFHRVPDTTTPAQKAAIYAFMLDHLRSFGTLPMDMEIPAAEGEQILNYDQLLSALTPEQIRALSDEYDAIEADAQQDTPSAVH